MCVGKIGLHCMQVTRENPDWRMRIFRAAYEHATMYDPHYDGFLWRVLVLCTLIKSTKAAFIILEGRKEQVSPVLHALWFSVL